MKRSADVIRARDLLRGVIDALPDTLTVNRGLFNLLLLSPDKVGSIGGVIERLAREQPDQPALRFEQRSWTYAEFNGWANRIAHVLRARGVVAGDSVAILMENRPEVLACVAGVVKLGAVAGMLNHHQRGEVLAHSIKLTSARVVIVGDECLEALESTEYTPKAQHAGDADEVAADAVFLLAVRRARQDALLVLDDALGHLDRRGGGGVVGAAGLEQLHDLGEVVARVGEAAGERFSAHRATIPADRSMSAACRPGMFNIATTAFPTSPQVSSATPITAHSATSGWRYSSFSTSADAAAASPA